MKSQLNQDLIERLSESSNQTFVENINNLVYDLVSSAVEDLAAKSPFVSPEKCILIPANEIYTGAVTPSSTYDYFFGIENPQIELYTKSRKNFWRYVWREFRASWRLGRKKYKKVKDDKTNTLKMEKYQLSDFKQDLGLSLAQYLTETTIIYDNGRYITLVGQQDFGTNVHINIYISCFDSNADSFKLYSQSRNKFAVVSFGERYKNIELKKERCGDMFTDMLKILNAIYSKTYDKVPNQILVESLLFNCPNILFDKGNVFKTFINIANYIRLKSPNSFMSICDTSKTIFDEKMIVGNGRQVDFSRIINMLDAFKY